MNQSEKVNDNEELSSKITKLYVELLNHIDAIKLKNNGIITLDYIEFLQNEFHKKSINLLHQYANINKNNEH
jgi:hypothetical protein